MRLGLGLLRLSPKTFWSMTPRELERALSALRPEQDTPGRHALAALMKKFPDEEGFHG